MSGIGGVRAFSPGAFTTSTLQGMAEALRHRGPDASSTWVGPDLGLTHTRMEVVDAAHAHQPMHSADGRWVVVLDGEVVNHDSLRSHLDYPFRTSGDTEVVVAGLAVEGISFVERLRGPFALVAHDLRTDTTHLVRDRLGVLPLYYRHVPGGIAFGSEIKALLALGPRPEVDGRSLDAYLTSSVVPAPDTLFEGVKKVRPAHRVTIMPRGHLEEHHYWAPPEGDPEEIWTAGDAIEAVGDGIRDAVRVAVATDAAVGAHLSGALGSSLLVAEMQQLRGGAPLHTFSVGFTEQPSDELRWARHVSELLGTEHHEVALQATDVDELWGRLSWHRDAPISAPGDVAVFGLARAAREHVRVVVSDEGTEELFGVQPQHRLARRVAERSAALPTPLRSRVTGPAERRLGAVFTTAERRRLLSAEPPRERVLPPVLGADPLDRQSRQDLQHWLPDHLLERADRLSMAASVAWRPALLDHHLVELAFRLPASLRFRPGTPRWVLKEVARPMLPDHVVDHRPARSAMPLDAWFREDLRDSARDRLTGRESWAGRTLDRAFVHALVEGHERGGHEAGRLWTLLALEMWHECFFGTPPTAPRPRRATTSAVAPSRRH
ncbi:asparagine synthase (glutamine-hydrolysing) [Nocardioides alpinus]|uniref:asparagine synthase (glutamine-hydrolyzing) n=1 Tax=Nocardioides alpinus TaxID=748909 RepID=A0A1I0VRD3_9ACTN|nr:asparagine synthase (glutamine-hydrolyzing) [Nocardioides alpinus]PKH37428.1 asparagine synthase (glutamine-hydrolyzing) [Nocardioides alpinus]SFA78901.1 asparagine synthase (glutamine-hydrolysing) [Nocardioides alpinus]